MLYAVGRLRLVLNAEGYEYTDLAWQGTGLRIVFHSPDERTPAMPEIVRGAILSVGGHVHINFRSTQDVCHQLLIFIYSFILFKSYT